MDRKCDEFSCVSAFCLESLDMFTNLMPVSTTKVRKAPDLVTGLGISKLRVLIQ